MGSDAGGDPGDSFRKLPGVDSVLDALRAVASPGAVADATRTVLDELRSEIAAGAKAPDFDEVVARTRALIASRMTPGLRAVVNATGVLIHTNLGRAPLGRRQLDAIAEVAAGYSNLEYDLDEGRRGSRYHHARRSIATLTGADSALVVNNNAAAVLVTLAALCRGKEVIISRGELIEIGGEFRIPDVMSISGARLVEVGTTNRTHLADYERAITPDTAAILKVHPSNYQVVGFTSSVSGRDLAALARGRGISLIHDVGSGLAESPPGADWVQDEPVVAAALEEGADVVTFSGDKLFGGPQAGIIVGRSDTIAAIEKNALLRALRVDKMTLAALEATVSAYLTGTISEIPLWALATANQDELQERADAIVNAVVASLERDDIKMESTSLISVPGGGSLPGASVPSWGIAIAGGPSPDSLHRALRLASPPVIARIKDDRIVLDLRTVLPAQDPVLQAAVVEALRA